MISIKDSRSAKNRLKSIVGCYLESSLQRQWLLRRVIVSGCKWMALRSRVLQRGGNLWATTGKYQPLACLVPTSSWCKYYHVIFQKCLHLADWLIMETNRYSLEISATLKPGKIKPSTQAWLAETAESFAVMGAFLNIANPELYRAGRKVFFEIMKNPGVIAEGDAVLAVLKYWTSPFSGYGLISNCVTPAHRDNNSQGQWYDFLTTIGPYSGSRLIIDNLGLEFEYESGTMVALLGKLLRHGIKEPEGNRICLAQYMRDNVHHRMGIESPGWMSVARYDVQ